MEKEKVKEILTVEIGKHSPECELVAALQEAAKAVDECIIYRNLYESIQKKLIGFRDIAAKPDIHVAEMNKERFLDAGTAAEVYSTETNNPRPACSEFIVWLFSVKKADANK